MRYLLLLTLLLLQVAIFAQASASQSQRESELTDKVSRILGESMRDRYKDKDYDDKLKPLVCKKSGKYEEVCSKDIYETKGAWKEYYECLEHAPCEEQFGRRCGFTITDKLVKCLIEKLLF
jgi:hypothetical protein